MKYIYSKLIRDKVFIIALILAIISTFFVIPDSSYLDYIHTKVLVIMFTIMLAVAGIYETHFFDYIATKLVYHLKNIKWIALLLIWVTFFLSMFLTNDAVLLTIIPFTIFILKITYQEKYMVLIIILQTIAANLGSALTPMGDPQNIYLYAYYDLPFKSFMQVTFPITVIGFFLLTLTTLLFIRKESCKLELKPPKVQLPKLFLFLILLLNALLLVLRVVPEIYTIIFSLSFAILFGRRLIKQIDFGLLLTFICFFIFTGNLSRIDIIGEAINQILTSQTRVLFMGIFTSQLISNVPAAIMLSTFTDKVFWEALLRGVNIGSMGTLIASLASLISFKYVQKEYPEKTKTYIILYSLISLLYMIIIITLISI